MPAYEAAGDKWLSMDEVAKLPGIGASTTDKFGKVVNIQALLKALKEFGGTGSLPMQKNVAGPPMRGTDKSLYVFRPIDTDATRKPSSLDEVKDKVVDDLRRLEHFRTLERSAPDLEKIAQVEGLLSVALENDTVVQRRANVTLCNPHFALNQISNRQLVKPFPFPLPVIGMNREATEAIIDRALALPKDVPLSTLPSGLPPASTTRSRRSPRTRRQIGPQ